MEKNAQFLGELRTPRMWKSIYNLSVSGHRWEEIVESSDFKASSSTGMLKPVEVWVTADWGWSLEEVQQR